MKSHQNSTEIKIFGQKKHKIPWEIRICVQKIHEKNHGNSSKIPWGFHHQKIQRKTGASAKAAQRTQMDMALLLDAGSTATKIWSSQYVMAEMMGEQIKKKWLIVVFIWLVYL